ncbi:hypothetical protein QJS04_geneDACA001579 [Acorus gramineus]|uniref:Uncharacterized protein n=1 Tax=Acorus gramineus TaxID=55184 RepID=A0AAV9BFT6_ACOGR|nr:hypothetical protein QJS04_geneDACA001579 [Acorus gramineus]
MRVSTSATLALLRDRAREFSTCVIAVDGDYHAPVVFVGFSGDETACKGREVVEGDGEGGLEGVGDGRDGEGRAVEEEALLDVVTQMG